MFIYRLILSPCFYFADVEKIELGRRGEQMAVDLLVSKGYTILARNWRNGKSEVDLFARQAHLLVCVEVKTRETEAFGKPASFVDSGQQRMLSEAVEAYLADPPDWVKEVRYDIVAVIINRYRTDIMHIEAAFWPDNLGVRGYDP